MLIFLAVLKRPKKLLLRTSEDQLRVTSLWQRTKLYIKVVSPLLSDRTGECNSWGAAREMETCRSSGKENHDLELESQIYRLKIINLWQLINCSLLNYVIFIYSRGRLGGFSFIFYMLWYMFLHTHINHKKAFYCWSTPICTLGWGGGGYIQNRRADCRREKSQWTLRKIYAWMIN